MLSENQAHGMIYDSLTRLDGHNERKSIPRTRHDKGLVRASSHITIASGGANENVILNRLLSWTGTRIIPRKQKQIRLYFSIHGGKQALSPHTFMTMAGSSNTSKTEVLLLLLIRE